MTPISPAGGFEIALTTTGSGSCGLDSVNGCTGGVGLGMSSLGTDAIIGMNGITAHPALQSISARNPAIGTILVFIATPTRRYADPSPPPSPAFHSPD